MRTEWRTRASLSPTCSGCARSFCQVCESGEVAAAPHGCVVLAGLQVLTGGGRGAGSGGSEAHAPTMQMTRRASPTPECACPRRLPSVNLYSTQVLGAFQLLRESGHQAWGVVRVFGVTSRASQTRRTAAPSLRMCSCPACTPPARPPESVRLRSDVTDAVTAAATSAWRAQPPAACCTGHMHSLGAHTLWSAAPHSARNLPP